MAQMGDLRPPSVEQWPPDSRPVVILMSALDSMCKELAKSSVEVACVAVFNKEVFVVGTERGKGYANIKLDFQRDFITYCVSEEEKHNDQQRSKDHCLQHPSDELNRDKLKMAVEDLFSSCYGKALGKTSLVALPYTEIHQDPSDVEVKGLPDGIILEEPGNYDTSTLMKILENKLHISFVLRRPVLGERKMEAKDTSQAVKCENSSTDCFVPVQVKSEPHEEQEESEMVAVSVKEERDGPQYSLTSTHCVGGAGEDTERLLAIVAPSAMTEIREDREVEVTIEASAACWSRAGIDLALDPGRKPSDLCLHQHDYTSANRSTQRSTKWGMNVLRKWYRNRVQRPAATIELMSPAELDEVLREFYLNAKTSKKDPYTINSLIAIRESINRYLRGPPLRRCINILCDFQFPASNRTYREVCSALKMEGKAMTKHTVPVAAEDLLKLYQSAALRPSSPQTLLNKVWFDITFFLVRDGGGGRCAQREFTRESFSFGKDEHGRDFVSADKSERSDSAWRTCQKRRMYALPGDPRCPVSAFHFYLSKLNPFCSALFQHPILHPTTDIWYNTKPVGVNVLGSMMSRLSKEAHLSFIYTNHSIKMTPIPLLQGLWQSPSTKVLLLSLTKQCQTMPGIVFM
ncbi:hypothetical protein SKAU_G00329470 [Synaphobranchus kaupii]|uniref:Uncharacterized protein n=1 Tax=Synaphobranchus kaupii TaxID=118154 RepID=A0A9Q1IKQ2_SYNKA|nr:hypothetical protein SKAU_G00329470 [Synaphobranchus kaupii]